jgi:hypothetical protein
MRARHMKQWDSLQNGWVGILMMPLFSFDAFYQIHTFEEIDVVVSLLH